MLRGRGGRGVEGALIARGGGNRGEQGETVDAVRQKCHMTSRVG